MTVSHTAKNAIYLRRQCKVLLDNGNDTLSISQVASALKNIESLGYTFSPELLKRCLSLSEGDFVSFYNGTLKVLREMNGADVAYAPFYPNFPKQVMEMDDAELYINAIMHYLGDALGLRIFPEYQKEERAPLSESLTLKPIGLGDEEAFLQICKNLIGSKSSISSQDKEDLSWYIEHYHSVPERIFPQDIPHKENLSFVTSLLLKYPGAADVVLTRFFKTATDVLRLAVALSEGDVSLAENTVFKSFKRAERRLLLSLLERCERPLEDMLRYQGQWTRLGERLHPGEYKKRFPKVTEAFSQVRNAAKLETFNHQVEKALVQKQEGQVLELLQQRPGELARRMDHLLRTFQDQEAILSTFEKRSDKISTPVLMQVMTHFEQREQMPGWRSFFPKGEVGKLFCTNNKLSAISGEVCSKVVRLCRSALLLRFGTLAPLGKVYIDESLREHLVPFSQRSASKALRTLVRGSKLTIPEGDTIRFFIWWKEGMVNGKRTGRVDLDLSSVVYGEDWDYLEHISYTNLNSENYRAAHSGDLTSAPEGACEFIDLDIPSVLKYGGRYIVMSVSSFTRHPFCHLPECYAGWMMRKEPGSGEVFEPSTVVDKVDLAANTAISIPVILDLRERKMFWADLALTHDPRWEVNIERNQRGFVHMGRAITTLVKPSLYTLFNLHVEARGERVLEAQDADVVFSLNEGITPFDTEDIMANFM